MEVAGGCWSAQGHDGLHRHHGLDAEVAVAPGTALDVYLVVGSTGGRSEASESGGIRAARESPSQENPGGGGGQ